MSAPQSPAQRTHRSTNRNRQMKNNKIESLKKAMIRILHQMYSLDYNTNARVQGYIGNFNKHMRNQWTANGILGLNTPRKIRSYMYYYINKVKTPPEFIRNNR